jgi:hypothetical protein
VSRRYKVMIAPVTTGAKKTTPQIINMILSLRLLLPLRKPFLQRITPSKAENR